MCFKSFRLKHNILALIVCNQIHQHFMESMTNKLERQQCTTFSLSMQTPSHYTLPKILTINFLFSFIHQVGGRGVEIVSTELQKKFWIISWFYEEIETREGKLCCNEIAILISKSRATFGSIIVKNLRALFLNLFLTNFEDFNYFFKLVTKN